MTAEATAFHRDSAVVRACTATPSCPLSRTFRTRPCGWRKGSLYPALHRMEESGWIRAERITKENGLGNTSPLVSNTAAVSPT